MSRPQNSLTRYSTSRRSIRQREYFCRKADDTLCARVSQCFIGTGAVKNAPAGASRALNPWNQRYLCRQRLFEAPEFVYTGGGETAADKQTGGQAESECCA